MAFSVVQVGAALKFVDVSGVVSSLTLPTGITLRQDVPPRFVVYGRYVVLVNTPSQPLTIDASGTVRVLCPRPPRFAPTVSAINGGALSGVYAGVRCTFIVVDASGRTIAESDYSPSSGSVTLSSQFLGVTNVDTSPDTITARRLYRPSNGTSTNFRWLDIDGNTITTAQDDASDADLGAFAAPILGTVPDLTLIAQFKSRLFGVSREDPDSLRYTEVDTIYAWPGDNVFQIPPQGSDARGAIALIARRDVLGIGKQNRLLQFSGTSDTGASGFRMTVLTENVGVESNESVAVYRDTAYFLWKDGVYQWNSDGLSCISDGSADGIGNVRSWFATDDYFNRDRFQYAFGAVDPIRNKYRLFLASAGSDHEDSWVEFDINARTWWGPHTTTAFVPTSTFVLNALSGGQQLLVGAEAGTVYQDQDTRTDGTSTPIVFDIVTKRHDAGAPDLEKYFGELSLIGKAQPAGTLTVQATVGDLNATAISTDTADLTQSRNRMGRLGVGKHVQLEFINSEVDQDVQIYGYEIPAVPVGRR